MATNVWESTRSKDSEVNYRSINIHVQMRRFLTKASVTWIGVWGGYWVKQAKFLWSAFYANWSSFVPGSVGGSSDGCISSCCMAVLTSLSSALNDALHAPTSARECQRWNAWSVFMAALFYANVWPDGNCRRAVADNISLWDVNHFPLWGTVFQDFESSSFFKTSSFYFYIFLFIHYIHSLHGFI